MDNFDKEISSNVSSESIERAIADIDAALARISDNLANSAPKKPVATVLSGASMGKLIATMVVMLITTLGMVLSSYAYFVASAVSSDNVIATGGIDIEFVGVTPPSSGGGSSGTELDPISVMPGYVEMREVYVENIGSESVYIRAKAYTDITLDDKYSEHINEVDTSLVIFDIDEDHWKLQDGYYYYAVPLRGGQISTEFFTQIIFSEQMSNIYKDSTVTIRIVFEIVQATNNGATPFEAIGWPSSSEGGEP